MPTQEGYLWVEIVTSCLVWQIQHNCRSVWSLFVQHSFADNIILVVYVDDIVISSDDSHSNTSLKKYLSIHFYRRILVLFVIFLGQRSPALHWASLYLNEVPHRLIDWIGMLGSRPVDTVLDYDVRFDQKLGDVLANLGRYRLIGKLIYLTVTRLDITFVVGVLSRHMQMPHQLHLVEARFINLMPM